MLSPNGRDAIGREWADIVGPADDASGYAGFEGRRAGAVSSAGGPPGAPPLCIRVGTNVVADQMAMPGWRAVRATDPPSPPYAIPVALVTR
jgi:hypothetical protein